MQFVRLRRGAVMTAVSLFVLGATAHAQGVPHAWPGGGSGGATQESDAATSAVTVPRATSSALVTLAVKATLLRQVLNEIARQSGVHLYYSRYAVPLDRLVSLTVEGATATQALEKALDGTGVGIHVWSPTQIVLQRIETPSRTHRVRRLGMLHGHVVDAKTRVAIAGAQVMIDGTSNGAATDDDGAYRIASAPLGEHVVTARRIGYTPLSQRVTIGTDQDVTLDFALQESANMLDQVVVTGTVAPTEVRALPTPITVVTASDIARLGITDIDAIFRGSVPGAVGVDEGTHDGYPGLAFRGGIDFNQTYPDVPAKVYVDGVEMAYSNAISQIDPNTIDHIEITRGPQASTLYGAGAMVGVIQIFTKNGSGGLTHPQIDAQLAAGGLQSQWAGMTPRQDHSVGIRGGDATLAYAGGASYTSTGAWAPEYKSQRSTYFGRVSSTVGALRVQLTGQYSSRVYDAAPVDPYFVDQVRDGHWQTGADAFFTRPFYPDVSRTDGTFGLNLTYQPASWWTNRLVLGYDDYDNPRGQTQPRLTSPTDTMRAYSEFQQSRSSVAYNGTIDHKFGSAVSSALTLGIDHWQTNQTSLSAKEHADGTFAAGGSLNKIAYTNTGVFAQEQLGIANAFFVTAGIRGDRNDNFGAGYGAAIAPRLGISYAGSAAHDVTFKVRASYGEAILPPQPYQREASSVSLPFSEQLANPDLGPETQTGYDGGIELYFGTRASLQATYYDQRVKNLISTATLSAPTDTVTLYQNQNLGTIRNTGWEMQGTAALGRVSLTATYSIFNSTVERLNAAANGDGQGQYHLGDRLLLIPRSSGGLTAALQEGGTQVTLGTAYIGSFRSYDLIAYYSDVFSDTIHQPARAYLIDYPSILKWNVQVTRDLTRVVSAFLRVDNLTNSYRSEIDNISAVYGRLTVVGVKARW